MDGLDVTVTVQDSDGRQVHLRVVAEPGIPRATVVEQARRTAGEALRATSGGPLPPGSVRPGSVPPGSVPWSGDGELRDGAVLALEPPGAPRAPGVWPGASPTARVVGGPDAGATLPLRPGQRVLVGRSTEAALRLADPRVSRRHAELWVDADGAVWVTDLGSANGTTVDGRTVGRDRVPPGALVGVGDALIEVGAPGLEPAAVVERPDGSVAVHRPPRSFPGAAPSAIAWPEPPLAPGRQPFPLATVVLPVVLGVAMCFVLRAWQYLLFALLSPLAAVTTVAGDRRRGRVQHRRATRRHAEAVAAAEAALAEAVAADERRRRASAPDPATVALTAAGPSDRLWERRPGDDDWLALRLGLADLPAGVGLEPPGGPAPPVPPARSVPALVRLPRAGVLGVAGPRPQVRALGRWLLAQAAVAHPPDQLAVLVLAPDGDERPWSAMRWLPHARPRDGQRCAVLVGTDPASVDRRLAELVGLVTGRAAEPTGAGAVGGRSGTRPAGRSVLVLVDDVGSLASRPAMSALLRDGPGAGVLLVCLAEDRRLLPAECGAVAVFDDDPVPARLTVEWPAGDHLAGVLADQVTDAWADGVARALAPLRDVASGSTLAGPVGESGAAASLPGAVRLLALLDLLQGGEPSADAVLAGWERSSREPVAVVGATAHGPLSVNLRRDGPHALVAGTTGSGKSELLQSLVASLAAAHPPDRVTFLLVDYKGGSALRTCADLPHSVGLVTDLDGSLGQRALASLAAEVRRREALLAAAGVADVDALSARAGEEALPRLVIVVDEFATLAAELPDFVRGLVGIAQRGRSLGLHLVLATQRPAGAVTADIRANTNLRVCLRVTGVAESLDVLDAADAALLPEHHPGRAWLRVGSAPVVPFQTARVTAPPPAKSGAAPITCTAMPWSVLGRPPPPTPLREGPVPDEGSELTDLDRLGEAIVEAAARLGLAPPRRPWLPPLPELVPLDAVPAHQDERVSSGPVGVQAVATGSLGRLVVGVVDVPERQAYQPLTLDLAAGDHLLVAGVPGSGRTSTLRTVAAAAARACAPEDLHLYAVDGGAGALRALAALPHCGAVVGADDPERLDRLLRRLVEEAQRRRAVLAAGGFADVAEQRAAVAPTDRLPWLLLVVDRWESLGRGAEVGLDPSAADAVLRLLRVGPATGLRVVVTGDRSALLGRLPAAVPRRLLLRLADPADYALAGVDPRCVPAAMPPGRAILAGDGPPRVAQVAVVGGDPSGIGQSAAIERIAAGVRGDGSGRSAGRPFRVEPLPAVLPLDRALATAGPRGSPLWVLAGVGGDDSQPLGVDLAAEGPGMLVAGRRRTGRSTALLSMAVALAARGTGVAVVALRPSPLRHAGRVAPAIDVLTTDTDADRLRAMAADRDGPLAVLVDDAEALLDGAMAEAMAEVMAIARTAPVRVVAAGLTDDLLASFRGFTLDLRRSGVALLLGPLRRGDGDLVGARLDAASAVSGGGIPGRGVLVRHGVSTSVQTPCPPLPSTPGPDRPLAVPHHAG